MQITAPNRRTFDAVAAAAIALIVSLFPLTSSDLWWHLASGREIWKGGIPHSDPFSFASDSGLWLDHGWLFQAIVYPIHAVGGVLALQVVQVLLAFGIAFVILRHLAGAGLSHEVALFVAAVAMATAKPRLTLRPELVTLLFLVILLSWLRRGDETRRWPLLAIAGLSLLWMNMHPGAILGALIVMIWCADDFLTTWEIRKPLLLGLAFALPLVITPYGVASVLFPFRLRALVFSGGFSNTEWLPATFSRLPLLYGLVVAAAMTILAAGKQARLRKPARVLIVCILAYLAFRYQRNVGVFAVCLPILIAPEIAAVASAWTERARRVAIAAAAVIALYSLFTSQPPGIGINRNEIAADAVDFVQRSGVRGNMFNQARFGGYLIWSLYPRQKVLIDGRNEVYTRLLPRLAQVVADDRQWRAFLREQQIEWAIIGYNNPSQKVVTMDRDGTRRAQLYPFGYLHFPPNEWALAYWDDVAMVMVRRQGVNAHLAKNAPRYLWPEDPNFAARQINSGAWPRAAVAKELEAAIQARPNVSRAYTLADIVRSTNPQ